MSTYTAFIQRDGDWWVGWIEEISGVNSQGRTRDELLENLRSALKEETGDDTIHNVSENNVFEYGKKRPDSRSTIWFLVLFCGTFLLFAAFVVLFYVVVHT